MLFAKLQYHKEVKKGAAKTTREENVCRLRSRTKRDECFCSSNLNILNLRQFTRMTSYKYCFNFYFIVRTTTSKYSTSVLFVQSTVLEVLHKCFHLFFVGSTVQDQRTYDLVHFIA
jgi:hypothetical protein